MNKTEQAIVAAFKTRPADGNGDQKPHNSDWVEDVTKTEHPVKNKDIFHEDANRIAKYFSSPKVSPKGLGQAVQKLNFYIQRGKHNLAEKQISKVKKAMEIIHKENESKKRT